MQSLPPGGAGGPLEADGEESQHLQLQLQPGKHSQWFQRGFNSTPVITLTPLLFCISSFCDGKLTRLIRSPAFMIRIKFMCDSFFLFEGKTNQNVTKMCVFLKNRSGVSFRNTLKWWSVVCLFLVSLSVCLFVFLLPSSCLNDRLHPPLCLLRWDTCVTVWKGYLNIRH